MNYTPYARILLRYGIGAVIGLAYGDKLAADPDVVTVVALLIGSCVEAAYLFAKKKGWAT